MLTTAEAAELARLMRDRAKITAARGGGEPLNIRVARIRERLVAAFGEADVAAAEALNTSMADT